MSRLQVLCPLVIMVVNRPRIWGGLVVHERHSVRDIPSITPEVASVERRLSLFQIIEYRLHGEVVGHA